MLGLAGLLTGVEALRVIGLSGYLLFGAGAAPWALIRALDLPLRLVLSTGTSLAVLILGSTVMLQTGQWHPGIAGAAVLIFTVPIHAAGVFLAWYDTPAGLRRPHLSRPADAHLLAGAGVALCLLAALLHRHIDPGHLGLPGAGRSALVPGPGPDPGLAGPVAAPPRSASSPSGSCC